MIRYSRELFINRVPARYGVKHLSFVVGDVENKGGSLSSSCAILIHSESADEVAYTSVPQKKWIAFSSDESFTAPKFLRHHHAQRRFQQLLTVHVVLDDRRRKAL